MSILRRRQVGLDVFLICTGLGRVQRGFESYIRDLSDKLSAESINFSFKVFHGKNIPGVAFNQQQVAHLPRGLNIYRQLGISELTGFNIEQITFFFGVLPYIILGKPKAIYIGEYNLYCYLYKFRKIFGLSYSLILYTGGQAIPGLFDKQKDFVHHITDVYYNQLIKQGIPDDRQFILPHFIDLNFSINEYVVDMIRQKANGKKIFLSVGQIDKKIKRMHLIPQIFAKVSDKIFPVIVGGRSVETEEVITSFKETFGTDGFLVAQSPRSEIGSYYAAADCFVLCSPKESFGLAFIEGLFFNLPVLCHDFREVRFVLKNNANYLDLNQIVKSSEWVEKNFSKLKKYALDEGYLFVKENYTWDKLRPEYLSMFNAILLNK